RQGVSQDLVGKMVKGPSGRHLGRITVATPQRMAVDVEGKQVWLSRDTIFSEDGDQVTVIFEPPAIGRYALRGRGSERAG
ncbi:MAG: hypothetical protein ACREN5_14710, partial [Gemmatimonadales bacterium]